MLVIWNPNAGSIAAAEEVYTSLLARPNTEVIETHSADQATQLVADRIRNGEKDIVAAGGDGTINAVINGMMALPSAAKLGVLPLGTANDWCSSLCIPDDVAKALELLDSGFGGSVEAKSLDVIEVETGDENRFFANIATGGNSHRVTESITTQMKQTWGALCYLRGTIDILNDLETFQARISFDGEPAEQFDVWNIIIANGKTSGGRLEVAPNARLDDGLLDIIIIRDGTLLDLAGMTFDLLTKRRAYIESDQVVYRQAKSIAIDSSPPLLFSIDGDLVGQQPLQFRVSPHSIRVIVGSNYAE